MPLQLAQQSPEQVRFFNTVFGCDRSVSFHLSGRHCNLSFTPDDTPGDAKFYVKILVGETCELWVALLDTSNLDGLDNWIGDTDFRQLPDEVVAVVVEDYLADMLQSLGSQIGEVVSVVAVESCVPEIIVSYKLPFVLLNEDQQRTRGALLLGDSWSSKIGSLISSLPVRNNTCIESLRVPAAIELGRSSLTLTEIETLVPHAVVMIDQSNYLDGCQVVVTVENTMQLSCEAGGDELIVNDIQEGPLDADAVDHKNGSLEDIRLPIVVHAGATNPTVGQLRRLASGDRLQPCGPTPRSVSVSIADRLIGSGELVQSGDRLGVRLLEVHSQNKLALIEAKDAEGKLS